METIFQYINDIREFKFRTNENLDYFQNILLTSSNNYQQNELSYLNTVVLSKTRDINYLRYENQAIPNI